MHFINYLHQFITKHGISQDFDPAMEYLRGEMAELEEAVNIGNKQDIISELCDVCIVSFRILIICGVTNPVARMYAKLREVEKRPHYQEMARRLAENIKADRL